MSVSWDDEVLFEDIDNLPSLTFAALGAVALRGPVWLAPAECAVDSASP